MTNSTEQPLKPAEFKPQAPAPVDPTESASTHRPQWLLPGIGLAGLALLLVVVVLPNLVGSDPESSVSAGDPRGSSSSGPGNPTAETEQSSAPAAGSTGPQQEGETSPFADAQQQKRRRAAQEALQTVLELQDILQELGVEQWASETYSTALVSAGTGDAAYRDRDFVAAASAYQEAAGVLIELEASIPARADRAISEIERAVETGDESTAQEQMTLLSTFSPGHPDITALKQRIDAMPEVAEALQTARSAAEEQRFNEAIQATQRAVEADSEHLRASELLTQYRKQDADSRFRRSMSDGYLALEDGQFDTAEAAFKRAASIRPGAPEPETAQVELSAARTAATLQSLQAKGLQQEADEAWEDAASSYEKALSIDKSLAFAQDGFARAEPRAELARRIQQTLEEPERLVDARALAAAEAVLEDARAVTQPGPVLLGQIDKLAETVSYATTPVSVTITSDGATDVTLLRVARLGTLTESEHTLRPGSYTAMGVRNGYRDVRVSFEVVPGEPLTVDVRCNEAI